VCRSLLEFGPSTVGAIAGRLGLTASAVRKHLDGLLADGVVTTRQSTSRLPRGRGRPARTFMLTDAGRDRFENAYDDLAVGVLRYLAETGGPEAVEAFARSRVGELESRYAAVVDGARNKPEALAAVLTADGYAASVHATPAVGGVQLCQHHCPVAHVAEQFPQLCEAETAAFERLLGTHVQRLATIAHGDVVCTTYVPSVAASDGKHAVPTGTTPARTSRRANA
jgi:predicted ArsR family transcriptional regulator